MCCLSGLKCGLTALIISEKGENLEYVREEGELGGKRKNAVEKGGSKKDEAKEDEARSSLGSALQPFMHSG